MMVDFVVGLTTYSMIGSDGLKMLSSASGFDVVKKWRAPAAPQLNWLSLSLLLLRV